MYSQLKNCVSSLLSLFFPDLCCVCGRILVKGEEFICLHCQSKLPKIFYHTNNTLLKERFVNRIPCDKMFSFLYFSKEGVGQTLVHAIKYRKNRKLGIWCGAFLYKESSSSGFFEGIDALIPVPLHKKKQAKRGFNQSEAIALGVSRESGIQVDTTHLLKTKYNQSQTAKRRYDRWVNSRETFACANPEELAGKHLLLIDDVLTTGSTVEACVQCLRDIPDVKVSVLTLAVVKF